MNVWAEIRQIERTAPLLRGRVSATDSGRVLAFARWSDLEAFIADDLRQAGLADARWEPDGGPR